MEVGTPPPSPAEPESPNEGACLRNMMIPNRQMRGSVVKVKEEPEWPDEGAGWR